jgi:hypothetical protein
MPINAEEYRLAAHERYRAAVNAGLAGDNVAAHYLAGVAVECMLRAYRCRLSRRFSSRHQLYDLATESRFLDLIPRRKLELRGVFDEINLRWRNDHRYYPAKKLRNYLHDAGMTRLGRYKPGAGETSTVRGDVLKLNLRRMIELARDVLAVGEERWQT